MLALTHSDVDLDFDWEATEHSAGSVVVWVNYSI